MLQLLKVPTSTLLRLLVTLGKPIFVTNLFTYSPNVLVYQGAINTTEEPDGEVVYVGYVTPVIPSEITVSPNQFETFYYISAFRSSLDTDSDVNIST
jgi:hypothetical protein